MRGMSGKEGTVEGAKDESVEVDASTRQPVVSSTRETPDSPFGLLFRWTGKVARREQRKQLLRSEDLGWSSIIKGSG